MSRDTSFKSRILSMQGNLFSFALRLTADKDKAQDLVQDTTLKALDNEGKFVNNTNFKGWMFTIMRNIFINCYRQTVKEAVVAETSDDLYHYNLLKTVERETPEGVFETGEISRAINSLPPEFAEIFSMYVAGYKYDEIARQLSIPLGTVKSRIFATRVKLKAILKDYR